MLHRAVIFALAGLMLAVTAPMSNAAVDAAKLRAAAPLPSISFSFGYQATEGLILSSNGADQAAQLNTLKKSLNGGMGDAERWRQIGLFYFQLKDTVSSQAAYTRASALYRAQVRQRPSDETLLVRCGVALNQSNLASEAETVLRRAVRLAPKDANAWSALGMALSAQVFPALLTSAQRTLGVSFEQPALLSTQFQDYKPSGDQIKLARQRLREAQRCLDKAVSVQPSSAIGYSRRAGFRGYSQSAASLVLDALTQENLALGTAVAKASPLVMHNFFNGSNALADTRRAAICAPGDLPTVAGAVMFEVSAVMSHASGALGADGTWKSAAPEKRQVVMQDIQRLERIARSKNVATATQAANAAALIWMFADQKQEAERDLRLALALDPHNQSAWDGLTAIVVSNERYKDATALAEQRLKTLDNAHTRLTLAKIDDKLNLPAAVQTQVQAALKDEPGDLSANLAQLVLLLRRSGDPAVLAQAFAQIKQCEVIYNKNMAEWKNYAVTVSIYNALTGSEAQARQDLAHVLADEPDNKEALQVLAALGPTDTQKQIL